MADSSEANGVSASTPDVADENSMTLQDILDEEEELEEDANAVLGGSDDKNCTYAQGYVKRQALYACVTCVPVNGEPAGVCLACSYACHEGHDLYELYTKRNFRCDCGNSRFPSSNQCRLSPVKDVINEQNTYNHNFRGLYCTCGRPYPDPDDNITDDMLQCIICEDWYHGRHLGSKVPDNQDYSEMVCFRCMCKHPFLWRYYSNLACLSKDDSMESPVNVKVETINGQGSSKENAAFFESSGKVSSSDTSLARNGDKEEPDTSASCLPSTVVSTNGTKGGSDNAQVCDSTTEEELTDNNKCLYQQLPFVEESTLDGHSAFWPSGWRCALCRCSNCQDMYGIQKCSYLLDEDDTVQAYEERGKEKRQSVPQGDPLMSALGTLGRVQQIEAIHGYNNLKSELTDFLKKFADTRKVVREEDVREFFVQMQARKRQRVSAVPHFCR